MKKSKSNLRSAVMRYFNHLSTELDNASEAMRKAWQLAKLEATLKEGGEAVIRFFKKNDDIPQQRHAVSVSGNYEAKGTGRKKNPFQFTYFDDVKKGVRSFNIVRFSGFVAVGD